MYYESVNVIYTAPLTLFKIVTSVLYHSFYKLNLEEISQIDHQIELHKRVNDP